MANIDPATLLEWLTVVQDGQRDGQLMALEELCMSLLMSDNVDRCFARYPPNLFVPALSQIFLDESVPVNVLEVTARAITYFLDISPNCTKRIIEKNGALQAICNRLIITETGSRIYKDLAEQCCKVLEIICTRESRAVLKAGGLSSALLFVNEVGCCVHKDALHSAMTIVCKLCTNMEPNETSLPACVESLSKMLKHDDNHVSDGALKCFVSLSDRFARSKFDPAPLAQHGLLNELLLRLSSAAGPTAINIGTTGLNAASSSTAEVKSSQSISTVIGLLTTLCRGSKSVSHDLFRSNLADAIEKALEGDEKCCLDTMRFVDLLLILLLEGHNAIAYANNNLSIQKHEHSDPSTKKSQSHIMKCVKSKDSKALIEAIESGEIDVHFVDEVGQTLLNWASAFGTEDMVEYLCAKGADVNKGLRSSSLHYAAWFGRTSTAKILLKNGADPNIRDEEGKTPLDKAKEKMEKENEEIVAILESPEWSMSSNNETKGDPEMAEIYLKRFMPMFCHTFQSALLYSIRIVSLSLIEKMVHYIKPDWLEDLCKSDCSNDIAPLLVEVLATVLDNEDEDSHVIALQTIYELLNKCQHIFLDHFASLGFFCRIQHLIDPGNNSEKDSVVEQVDSKQCQLEDAKEILPGQAYHWSDWFFCRGKDGLYIWNSHVALELSNGSNGWFRFIINNRLSTMYSNGYLIGYQTADPLGDYKLFKEKYDEEYKANFIEKYLKAKELVTPNSLSQPILSIPNTNKMAVGNWLLTSTKKNSLSIQNYYSLPQIIRIKSEKFGLLFRSNDGNKHRFVATMPHESDINSGWETIKKANSLTTKSETVGQEIQKRAQNIYDKFFKTAQAQPRSVVISLSKIVTAIEFAIKSQSSVINDDSTEQFWASTLYTAISDLQQLLMEKEGSVSAYEIYSSGLVEILLQLFTQSCLEQDKDFAELQKRRINIFVKCFKENADSSCASVLVQKLISVLESIERFPVYLYKLPGAFSGLQILSRCLNFRMEMGANETNLINRTGRGLRMEPLTTVNQLEKHLLKLVVKQWYANKRTTLSFFKKLCDNINLPMEFEHEHDFDKNGVLYWVGTNGKTSVNWVNPGKHGLMTVRCSDGQNLAFGHVEDILDRNSSPHNCHTHNDKKSWFSIDLGLWIIPTKYTLRHAKSYSDSALRNWLFQVSKDSINWTTLGIHIDDKSLNESGSTATWSVKIIENEIKGWRYIRLKQNGTNSSGETHYISLSGFEIYGSVTGVCDNMDEVVKETKKRCPKHQHQHQHHTSKAKSNRHIVPGEQSMVLGIDGCWRELNENFNRAGVLTEDKLKALRSNGQFQRLINFSLPEESNDRLCTGIFLASTSEAVSANNLATMQVNEELADNVESVIKIKSSAELKSIHSTPSVDLATNDMPSTSNDETQQNIANNEKNSNCDHDESFPVLERIIPTSSLSSFTSYVDKLQTNLSPDSKVNSKDKPIIIMHHNISDTSNSQIQDLPTDTSINNANNSAFLTAICNAINLEEENKIEEKRNISSNGMEVFVPNLIASPMSQGNIISVENPLAETSSPNQLHKNIDADSHNSQSQDNHMPLQITASISGREPLTLSTNLPSSLFEMAQRDLACNTIANSSRTTNTANRALYADEILPSLFLSTSSNSEEQGILDGVQQYERNLGFFDDIDDEDVDYDEDLEDDEELTQDYHDVISRDELLTLEAQAYEIYEARHAMKNATSDSSDNRQRKCSWDDDYVLKTEFTALIPGFDPRPGRTNISQTCDLEVIAPSEDKNDESSDILMDGCSNVDNQPLKRLKLTLKGPNMPGIKDVEVELKDSTWTIFHAVQKLAQLVNYGSRQEKCKRIWEPTYTIIYEELTDEAQRLDVGPDNNQWDSDLPIFSTRTQLNNTNCTVDHVLQLLRELHNLFINPSVSLLKPYADDIFETYKNDDYELINGDVFYSKKITSKLVQQIQDALVLSSNALPSWCDNMILSYSFLFPFETRHLYFNCTAFGPSRSIVWLQSQRDNVEVNNYISSSLLHRRQNEFREGRLQHDRVRIPRDENIFAWGKQIMRAHIDRQTVLEVEFMYEEGTGLGPTLEFYSLIAAEFQRKDLCMWICGDEMHDETIEYNSFRKGAKPPGYYVTASGGLFPAPLPQDSPCCDEAVKHFWFLGVFLAKVLQDNRLIDLPLSLSFLKLLIKSDELNNVLDESDYFEINQTQALFIKQLKELIVSKEKILLDQSLKDNEKCEQIKMLQLQYGEMKYVHLESLCLTMIYLPSSRAFPFLYINLVDGGFDQDVNMNNVEQYVNLLTDLMFNTGIKRQIEALKAGFSRVFSIKKLNAFTPLELRQTLCGQQEPEWTREDLFNYTLPKLGYTKESPGFIRLVNVLEKMNSEERKSFLQFATGCSSLPPGGLANLYPRLTVVRKVDGGAGSYPSVNTCVHYLKLPEYPDEETLRDRLLTATLEERFLLN